VSILSLFDMPKFQDAAAWEQAEQLMQPVFIRLVDNLRKQLDLTSAWRGTYEDAPIWPEGVSEDVKVRVLELQAQLKAAPITEAAAIESALSDLPAPNPGYWLCLTQSDRQVKIDLWELCYRICFRDYDPVTGTSRSRGFGQSQSRGVEVDRSLFDETGEVDWNRLDDKTQKLVAQIFANLPGRTAPSEESRLEDQRN
jgi:hypothetical protein